MDQNLDLQIAALIFLGGTQNLVSGSDHGGVETMSDDEEVEAEPGNTTTPNKVTVLFDNYPLLTITPDWVNTRL